MTIIRITIINPKAKKLLKVLEELNLIAIENTSGNILTEALKEVFSKEAPEPTPPPLSLEEIVEEVNIVRRERHERKG